MIVDALYVFFSSFNQFWSFNLSNLQRFHSPFELSIENPTTPILTTARELGVAIVAYSPLGRGFITGKYKSVEDFEDSDFRKIAPRFSKENFSKNLGIVHKFEEIALRRSASSGQVCLAWLLAQGENIFVIPGYSH